MGTHGHLLTGMGSARVSAPAPRSAGRPGREARREQTAGCKNQGCATGLVKTFEGCRITQQSVRWRQGVHDDIDQQGSAGLIGSVQIKIFDAFGDGGSCSHPELQHLPVEAVTCPGWVGEAPIPGVWVEVGFSADDARGIMQKTKDVPAHGERVAGGLSGHVCC